MSHTATLYRMKTPDHLCPFGLKAKDLLEREGFEVDDHPLRTRQATDEFMERWGVDTTPQVFIDDERIGGYDDLREHLGREPEGAHQSPYTPVIAVFAASFAAALALTWSRIGTLADASVVPGFIALAMLVLAILKLRDITAFTNQFVTYDLLARRTVRYAYVYPFAEAVVAIGMLAGSWLVAPIALFIGSIGAWSVFRAVYIEKRDLKCACVGGDSDVPLGFVSLSENLAMVAMGIWMPLNAFVF